MGSDNGLAPNRRQAIVLTNADLIHRRIYAALWGTELKYVDERGIEGIHYMDSHTLQVVRPV